MFDTALKEVTKILNANFYELFKEQKRYTKMLEHYEKKPIPRVKKYELNLPVFPKYSDVLHEFFDMLLDDPIKAQFFKEFLVSEKNDENLSFYLAIKDFSSKKFLFLFLFFFYYFYYFYLFIILFYYFYLFFIILLIIFIYFLFILIF